MDRVLTLGPRTPEAPKAAAAMRYLAKVEEDPNVNTPTVLWRVPNAPTELWDAPFAPQMVIIPAGEYTMGSMQTENKTEANRADFESPRHRVRIGYPLAVSKYLVTRAEFAYFVADAKYDFNGTTCNGGTRTWDNPAYPQTDTHPAVCASHVVAQAYADWLSRKTGHTYRLLSESEWEYAARGGTTTAFYWGNELGKGHANCPNCGSEWDRKGSSPVGSFPPNPFGLYDMAGNVWQVVADCWNYAYVGAPADGSPWMTGNCSTGVERGGNFSQASWSVRSAGHRGGRADSRTNGLSIHGFRVARVF
jgi:formylglycine-generating enzyme required for sulfatase activity